jgi:ribosomal-protein-alanine N-acetyltransferase
VKPFPTAWSTTRLKLRLPRDADVAAVFDYASHPDVTRFADWPAATQVEQVVTVVREWQQKRESALEFTWVVTERNLDRVIGAVSYRPQDSEVTFGYVLNRSYWGRGYATELALELVTRLLADQEVACVRATCDAENAASRRVLEKAGLKHRGWVPNGIVRPQIASAPRPACIYTRDRSGGAP